VIALVGAYGVWHKPRIPGNAVIQEVLLRPTDAPHDSEQGSWKKYVVDNRIQLETMIDGNRIGDTIWAFVEYRGYMQYASTPLLQYYYTRYVLLKVLMGSLYFLLAVMVLLRGPDTYLARIFSLMMIVLAVFITTSSGGYAALPFGVGYVAQTLFLASYCYAPAVSIHFAIATASRTSWHRRVLMGAYAVATLLWLAAGTMFLLGVVPEFSASWLKYYAIAHEMIRWTFVAGILCSIGLLIRSYLTIERVRMKKALRWILPSVVAGSLPFCLLWLLPQLLGTQPFLGDELAAGFAVVVPIGFAIAIMCYHMVDDDMVAANG
jgi:hypothetical protein